MDNGPTLEFARRLAALGRPIWVRFVLVPGLTDALAAGIDVLDVGCGSGRALCRRRGLGRRRIGLRLVPDLRCLRVQPGRVEPAGLSAGRR